MLDELDRIELGDRAALYLAHCWDTPVMMSARNSEPVNRYLLKLILAIDWMSA